MFLLWAFLFVITFGTALAIGGDAWRYHSKSHTLCHALTSRRELFMNAGHYHRLMRYVYEWRSERNACAVLSGMALLMSLLCLFLAFHS